MPDPTPDLVALADQVKLLSGDLNRRFDQLSNSITQLNSRIDALTLTHKVSLRFAAAMEHLPPIGPNDQLLESDWSAGTTSEFNEGDFQAQTVFLVRGKMFVSLPNLSRIGAFRASVRISNAQLNGPTNLRVSFQRVDNNGNDAERIAELAWAAQIPAELQGISEDSPGFPDARPIDNLILRFLIVSPDTASLPFEPGEADLQADPILGKEFVDNDRFRYFVLSEFVTMDQVTPSKLAQQGMVVLESFQVDCIVA